MDIFPLLDEIQIIARNGLAYANDSYDRERYKRLLELACHYYSDTLSLPLQEVCGRLSSELGHITPKVGADAAIFDASGRILLMKRSDDHCWCLPCGWVEPNEAPEEAVVREAREECGLEISPVQLVHVFTCKASIHNGPHTVIGVVYLCEVTGGALQLSHEGTELKYRYIDDVSNWHKQHKKYALAAHTAWRKQKADIPSSSDYNLTLA